MHAMSRMVVSWPGRSLLLKGGERFYRVRYRRRSKRLAQARRRFAVCKRRKTEARIGSEMAMLERYWGCFPFHYLRYDLYRLDRGLDEQELLAYIPEFFLYHVYLPMMEGPGDPDVLGDKVRTVAIFRDREIAQPAVLGWAAGRRWHDAEGVPLRADDMLQSWSGSGVDRIFLKPAKGSGGVGIRVLRPRDGAWYDGRGEHLDARKLNNLAQVGDWLAQAGVAQVHETARYYGGAVNTFRVNTGRIDGELCIPCAVMRLGGGGRELDNAALGGIMIGLDVKSGVTTPMAGNELMESFSHHPDSRYRFRPEGLGVWSEVQAFAIAAASRLPEYGHIAWDIAATPDGPVALEANLGFGIDCYQCVLGGLSREFGIREPRRFWR